MTADEQYVANMRLLAAHPSPELQRVPDVLAQCPLTNVHLMPNGHGVLVGAAWDVQTQAWVALCDIEDPLGQAARDVDAIYSPAVKVFTLLGVGLGHAAVALAQRMQPYQRLSLWEASPAILKAMFHALDCAPLFSDKRVHVFLGPDLDMHIEPYWLSLDVMEKLHLGAPLRAGYTGRVDAALYDALLERTADMLRHHMVGLSTWRIFGKEIGLNDVANLPEYFASPGYERLAGLWQDRPAVCIAAGPSLQKNLRVLLEPGMRQSVALITAGTTYALVQGLHLRPDLVTTIDFQRLNWTDQFRHIPLDPACALVWLHSTYPQTVRRWPGPCFVAENASDTMAFFRRFGEGKGQAAQVQTVAHLNAMVALMLGANPVCLIGQDLSMPPTQHHAAGARAQDQAPNEVPAEAFLTVDDCAGLPVATRHSFLSMKGVFERLAVDYPGRMVNCTEGGLRLRGIPNMPLAEALALHCGKSGKNSEVLRADIARVWRTYTPVISEELPQAVTTLRGQVETLLEEWCPAVAQAEMRRLRWDGCDPQEAPAYDGLGDAAVGDLLALEPTLQVLQPAFSLFVIRDFRLIETLAAVPGGTRWLTDTAFRDRRTCDRIVQLAAYVREGGDEIRRTLRHMARRLAARFFPMTGTLCHARRLRLALAQQRYRQVLDALATEKALATSFEMGLGLRIRTRFLVQALEQTNQYVAALAVLEGWEGMAPAHAQRIKQWLAQDAADVRAALPAYFAEHKATQSAQQEAMCGAYWGA